MAKATVKKRKIKAAKSAARTTNVVCGAELDIANVGELYACLKAALAAARPVVIDAVKVERADTAALQVLSAFAATARERGIAFQWRKHPAPALCSAAEILGLSGIFGLTE
ncbi:MAG: STAS domain-containing protein [Pseudomonadota bacterium]